MRLPSIFRTNMELSLTVVSEFEEGMMLVMIPIQIMEQTNPAMRIPIRVANIVRKKSFMVVAFLRRTKLFFFG